MISDYVTGIAYGTGYIAKENGKRFLFIRNLDSYYVKTIEKEVKYKAYESKCNIGRDGRSQWCIKVRSIHSLPALLEVNNSADFIRAYMELHAVVDLMNAKDRKGNKIKKLRLRIYGSERVLTFINHQLPAGIKKMQHIKNVVDTDYTGETCCIYYQSKKEIHDILDWIDGNPKNEKVWNKWEKITKGKEN